MPADLPSSGTDIGPYRILDVLGEGGMGVVYAAEQRQPIFRRVALKVIKVGMDTKEVLARFEAERQALALLDHPNVAKVLDAGATAEGRPFFAMELVRGLPITRYCDEGRLSVRERVAVVVQACAALQHAHERGILHRDIKPTNLLVTEIDGKPVVKVIDFGLAKATNQRLTERTLFTEEGRIIGTPEYMSPEQAETSAQDVDARTDVFSLGVVLYELLAGALPFDFQAVRAKGYLEVQRFIREEDPPTPRQRLSGLKNSLTEILALRRCRLQELAGSLRNGLDAVTMKAIAKARRDRYGSCAELAADLQRFLTGEPVLAHRVGAMGAAWNAARRFRRRHPILIPAIASAMLGGLLLLGLQVGWFFWLAGDSGPPTSSAPRTKVRDVPDQTPRGGVSIVPARLALLVGVGECAPSTTDSVWSRLASPESDVERARTTLIERLGIEPSEIVVLVGAAATHEAIVRTFKSHLIDRAGPASSVLFWFSGHGSRVADASMADGSPRVEGAGPFDETMVAYDSRAMDPDGGYDLTDDELFSLLRALRAKDVVVVSDSDHSGGLYPSMGSGQVGKSTAPPARLLSFWPSDVAFVDDDRQSELESLVLIAGCGASEESGQLSTPLGSFGTMSWFLTQVLTEMSPSSSWSEVAAVTRARVGGKGTRPGQHVLAFGDSARTVVAGARRASFGYQVDHEGHGVFSVGVGALHGAEAGSVVSLLNLDGTTVGRARLETVRSTSSRAAWISDGPPPEQALTALLEHAGEAVSNQLRVALGIGTDRGALSGLEWFCRSVPSGGAYDYQLLFIDDSVALIDRDGQCVAKLRQGERDAIQARLMFEHRYRVLSSTTPGGRYPIDIIVESATTEETNRHNRPAALVRTLTSGAIVGAPAFADGSSGGGALITIRVTNRSDEDLHIAMLSVSEDREINQLLGLDPDTIVRAGGSVSKLVLVGTNSSWPSERPMRDRYVVVATPHFAEFSAFVSRATVGLSRRDDARTATLPPVMRAALGGSASIGGDAPPWGIATCDLQVVTPEAFAATKDR